MEHAVLNTHDAFSSKDRTMPNEDKTSEVKELIEDIIHDVVEEIIPLPGDVLNIGMSTKIITCSARCMRCMTQT